MLRRILAGGLLCVACLQSTPFDVNVHERDRTRTNLETLSRRTPRRPFKFVALGDTHSGWDELARTVDVLNARHDIELVLVAGDMSELGLRRELEWTRKQLDRLRVPYLTAIGNHDAISSGAAVYRRMFGPFDYRFRFGGVEFVVFNSNSLEFPGQPVPDFAWIDAQLDAARDADARVLVTHLPPAFPGNRPEGSYDPERYARLFREHDVALMISSHLDVWELKGERGAVFLQCATFKVHQLHTIITMDGPNLTFERCRFDACEPVAPVLRPGPLR